MLLFALVVVSGLQNSAGFVRPLGLATGRSLRFAADSGSKRFAADSGSRSESGSESGSGSETDTSLRAGSLDAEPKESKDLLSAMGDAVVHGIEDTVHAVTGDDEYHFGDLSKKIFKKPIEELTGEDASKYQFGDITRRFAHSLDSPEHPVNQFTGKRKWQMGDVTKKLFADAANATEHAMMHNDFFHDLPKEMGIMMFKNLTPKEREELFMFLGTWGAIGILLWSLLSNAATAVISCAAWTWSSRVGGVSPLASHARWSHFLHAISSLRLLEAGLLPIKAVVAAVLAPRYYDTTLDLERRFKGTSRARRAIALVSVYAGGAAAVSAATLVGLAASIVVARVPLRFPPAGAL